MGTRGSLFLDVTLDSVVEADSREEEIVAS
jgi:hypothetical protein